MTLQTRYGMTLLISIER